MSRACAFIAAIIACALASGGSEAACEGHWRAAAVAWLAAAAIGILTMRVIDIAERKP